MAKQTISGSATITRDDLERNFRSLQQGVQGKVEDSKPKLLAAAAGVGVLVALLLFLLGRRSGKKKTTLVEIRRF